MPIPSYEALIPRVLRYATEERQVREAVNHIADELELDEVERAETIPTGPEPLISSRVQWAITYLVQAGLLVRPRRAHFIITEHGRRVLEEDVHRLDLAYLKQIPIARRPKREICDASGLMRNEVASPSFSGIRA